jgi:hypothetical protein
MKCTECFDNHLNADLLAEFCHISVERPALGREIVTFTCPHGGKHRHSVYSSAPFSGTHCRVHIRVSMWASEANRARRLARAHSLLCDLVCR